jgi:hypothetical protein
MHTSVLIYRQLMLGLWLAWLLYWVISALSAKTTQRRESLGSRLSHVVPLLIGVGLIVCRVFRRTGCRCLCCPIARSHMPSA